MVLYGIYVVLKTMYRVMYVRLLAPQNYELIIGDAEINYNYSNLLFIMIPIDFFHILPYFHNPKMNGYSVLKMNARSFII